jgi:hypothetical protein
VASRELARATSIPVVFEYPFAAMGFFGKKKADAYRPSRDHEKPPHVVKISDYKPPQLSPVTQLHVEVDNESNHGPLTDTVQYSKSDEDLVNAEKTTEDEAVTITSISSIDGPNPMSPLSVKKPEEAKLSYQPIRYEPAKPPNIFKAPAPPPDFPETKRVFPLSPTSLQTTPPISPRVHYHCPPSLKPSQTNGPHIAELQHVHRGGGTRPDSETKKTPSSPNTVPSAKCGCLEINGACGGENYTVGTAVQDEVPMLRRGVLSSFSHRFTNFSHHVRSKNQPLNAHDESKPPILQNHHTEDEDTLTISTGGTKDTLFSFSKLSRDGSMTLVPANEDVQCQIQTWTKGAMIGKPMIRFLAILAAFVAIVATIFLMAFEEFFWTMSNIICAMYTILSGMLIMILEVHHGREEDEPACLHEANHLRERLRQWIVRNFNMLKMVWGRGALYVYAASMALTISHFSVLLPGAVLSFIGIIAIAEGAYASSKLETLTLSFSDEELLREMFTQSDHDFLKSIDAKQFQILVRSLGLELDAGRSDGLFDEIDVAQKGRITFQQFKEWWLRDTYIGDGTSRKANDNHWVLAKPEPRARNQTGKHLRSQNQNRFHGAALDALV